MTGIWQACFVILWIVVVALALVVLALAREIEALHARLEAVSRYLSRSPVGKSAKENPATSLASEKTG